MRARAIPTVLAILGVLSTPAQAGPCDTAAAGPPPPPAGAKARPTPRPRAGTGVILGKVVMEDGTPFGFVDIAIEPETGFTHTETSLTEEDGTFRFPSVPVGNYRLSAFADGYKQKETFTNIGVTAGSSQSVVVTLVRSATETLDVVVGASVVDVMDLKTSDTSSTVSGEFVNKIPLQNKRIEDIKVFYPGITRTDSSDSTDISVGGSTSGQVGYRLNGQSVNDPVNGGPVLDVPASARENFKLVEGGFNAEYGEQSSGVAKVGRGGRKRPADAPTSVVANVMAAPVDREAYGHRADNAMRRSLDEPLSTFAVDVDTASYSNVRRFLNQGHLPPSDAVRVEELLNYFRYETAAPVGNQPFGATTELADCPWAPDHRLLRVSLTTEADGAAARAPRSLVFLIDVSGSMGEPAKLPLVQQSLRLLVDRLDAQDEVGIVVYAGAAGLVLPLTPASDKKTILCAIDRLSAGGSTNGAQGIQLAYELAETAQKAGAMSRVILATDGDFNVGVTSEGDLVRLIETEREKGIALTVLGFGTGNLQDDRMEALADHGNGNYAYVDCLEEARKVLDTEMTATLVTVAKDVKIQIEFNPATVREYRLIGYENRLLAAQDFDDDKKDAGEIGAGHQVTALYEIVSPSAAPSVKPLEPLRYQQRAAKPRAAHADELALLRIRWKAPDGDTSRLFERTIANETRDLAQASPSLRFAAAVAAFGLKLRGSEGGELAWVEIRALAASGMGRDEDGLRTQFLGLVDTAAALKGEG